MLSTKTLDTAATDSDVEEQSGFRLTFTFEPNEFMSETVLVRKRLAPRVRCCMCSHPACAAATCWLARCRSRVALGVVGSMNVLWLRRQPKMSRQPGPVSRTTLSAPN